MLPYVCNPKTSIVAQRSLFRPPGGGLGADTLAALIARSDPPTVLGLSGMKACGRKLNDPPRMKNL